jgi:phospholipase D1/2
VRGAIFVWIASMFGAVIGYFVARGVWSRLARRLLGPRAEKLEGLRKGNVALTAFRMQLMPLVPFGVFNYAAGITKLPLVPFLIGTAFGIIPGTLLATYVSDRFVAGMRGEDPQPLYIALAVTIVLFGLSFLPKLIEKSRQR